MSYSRIPTRIHPRRRSLMTAKGHRPWQNILRIQYAKALLASEVINTRCFHLTTPTPLRSTVTRLKQSIGLSCSPAPALSPLTPLISTEGSQPLFVWAHLENETSGLEPFCFTFLIPNAILRGEILVMVGGSQWASSHRSGSPPTPKRRGEKNELKGAHRLSFVRLYTKSDFYHGVRLCRYLPSNSHPFNSQFHWVSTTEKNTD